MRGWASLFVVFLVLGATLPVRAQEPDAALVVRLDPLLAPLGAAITTRLARRLERDVTLGSPLTAEESAGLPETVPTLAPGVVGLARSDARVLAFGTAPSGARHLTAVGWPADESTVERIVVIALASLVDALAADVAPSPSPSSEPEEQAVVEDDLSPLDASALTDLADPVRPVEGRTGFVLEARSRLLYATQRDQGFGTAGLAAGACVAAWWCLVAEADVELAEERRALTGSNALRYLLLTTVGVGGRFLPLEAGPVWGGVGLDALVRVGRLTLESPLAEVTTVSGGMRMEIEAGVHLADVLSIVLEVGADIFFNAVRFQRGGAFVLTEDVATLWAGLGLRLGPL
ncbi:MAG: hypothetical protein U0234_25525 [Sandaracinus sp.]